MTTDLQVYLQNLYVRHRKANKAYTLRAFARAAGLSPSFLSEVMNGKKGLSAQKASLMATHLKLSTLQRSELVRVAEMSGHSDPIPRGTTTHATPSRAHDFQKIEEQHFQILENWQYLALLECLNQNKKTQTSSGLARKLNITPAEVEKALSELERHGFIDRRSGKLTVKKPSNTTRDEVPSAMIRQFHAQMLQRATFALHDLPAQRRSNHSLVFSARQEALPEMKRELMQFLTELSERYSDREKGDTVFAFTAQLFPLSGDDKP